MGLYENSLIVIYGDIQVFPRLRQKNFWNFWEWTTTSWLDKLQKIPLLIHCPGWKEKPLAPPADRWIYSRWLPIWWDLKTIMRWAKTCWTPKKVMRCWETVSAHGWLLLLQWGWYRLWFEKRWGSWQEGLWRWDTKISKRTSNIRHNSGKRCTAEVEIKWKNMKMQEKWNSGVICVWMCRICLYN